jgi:serine/threonine protein phosphatase PrpC
MKLQVTSHGLSRNPKAVSDDAICVRQRGTTTIAALADGIGSSEQGGDAARRAVAMLSDYYVAKPQTWGPHRALSEFVSQINRVFHQESQARHGSAELVCTLSAVALAGNWLHGFNVGDSPVYLWRKDRLITLSQNHALAQAGMEHVLARAVGLEAAVEPHFFETTIDAGDVILLCSDGVSNALPPETLARLLSRHTSARSIVSAAQDAVTEREEAPDDTSAIVIDVISQSWSASTDNRALEIIAPPKAGDVIDEYRLVRALQEGAPVWLAEKNDGARFVLKFPPQEAHDDEIRREGFVREMWQATRIDSPDFVRAFVPQTGTLRYYVMEYVDAPTLRESLRIAPLTVEDTVSLGHFLLRAAQFLLSSDYAHGDIKPDNILVLRSSKGIRFQLLDLGSAAEVFSVTSRAGTPSYLAPERFNGAALSERTEIYAIGVTLYQALTRAYPFGEIERFQTPRFDTTPRRPTKLNPSIPAWLESIILRAIAPEIESRYQSFSEMTFELSQPEKVTPFYRKNAPLLERNPLLFYKLISLAFFLSTLGLLYRILVQK